MAESGQNLPPAPQQMALLFDDLVGAREHAWRDRKAERPCRLQVDDELEPDRPNYRQIGRFLALEDATGIQTDLPIPIRRARSVAHQPADFDMLAEGIHRRHPIIRCERDQLYAAVVQQGRRAHKQPVHSLLSEARKSGINVAIGGGGDEFD